MWRAFIEYFHFTKKERKGILAVVAIIAILTFLPLFFPFFIKEPKTDFSAIEKEIASLKIDSSSERKFEQTGERHFSQYDASHQKNEAASAPTLFFFDPNTATTAEWLSLGVNPRTAQTIQKYIAKGGKFRLPEDLKKIYGLSEKDVQRLIPFVSIKTDAKIFSKGETFTPNEKSTYSHKSSTVTIDANLADTSAFAMLYGVGNRLSNRIVSFREKLGGFYSVDQVGETYLLPDSTFQKIKKQLTANPKDIRKLNVNTASVDELKSHPYIRYQVANAIVQYRQQHGKFNNVNEIKKVMIVTEDMYNKILPYLAVE